VRSAQRALDDSGARERLRAMIDGTLAEARMAARDTALSPAAGALITELAARIEERIP
jgi:geranylgeranyl diphosphate synthase type II